MNVYPESGAQVVGFKYCTDLHLMRSIAAVKARRGEDAKYLVGRPYRARVKLRNGEGERRWHEICVPAGYKTDLASVPRPARVVVARAGPHLEACVVHDWLYEAWIVTGASPHPSMKVFADDVLRAAMEEANVRRHTAWTIFMACSRFGGEDFRREWTADERPSSADIIDPIVAAESGDDGR